MKRIYAVATVILSLGLLATAGAGPEPPDLRLPDTVHPTRYAVHLTLLPDAETFDGEVEIGLALREPTSLLWLHGAQLEIDDAALVTDAGRFPAKPIDGGEEHVGFELAEPVGPGTARLVVRYRGRMSEDEVGGLFRREMGDDWYIFSQMEPLHARHVFPCFDEPGFKIPLELSVTAKREHLVLSNTPVASETDAPDGMKTVRFEATRPLPTYLLAVAVGPFDVVDAGTAGRNDTPIRIVTPRGEQSKAAWAVEATGPILELLEEYFDSPYPYTKLDQIAVPNFLGAMENPGLVTYDHQLLLSAPKDETVWHKRGFASTCAHELAHMWFGDLVTMAWWDDVWLNESFATWMEDKIVADWKPEWDLDVSVVRGRGWAMGSDSLVTARRIREPIATHGDVLNAFDGITYGKGAAVLKMFEAWVGEEKFRDGVRRYIRAHADGSATAEDFLATLGEAGGADVASAFVTFIDQAGVPLVRVDLAAEPEGKLALSLSQQRYFPYGSEAPEGQLWQIPFCVEYGKRKAAGRECTLMTEPTSRIELRTDRDPDWLLPNADMAGYYRIEYAGDLLDRLLDRRMRLSLPERVGLIDDMRALVAAGKLDYGEALARVPDLLKEKNRHIVSATLSIVYGIEEHLVSPERRPNFARFVRKMYGKQARSLGWDVSAGDDDDTRLMRPRLLWLAAAYGEDPVLVAKATALAERWLEDRDAVHADLVGTALGLAARNGDAALWQRLYERAKTEENLKDRNRLLSAMGSFTDATLVRKNLDLVLAADFDFLEAIQLLFGALGEPETRELGYAYVKENFDALLKRMPAFYQPMVPYVAAGFCDEEHARDAEAFFGQRIADIDGGPRSLAQTLEGIRLCAAKRESQQDSVNAFLRVF